METERLGCFKLRFSNDGSYIACACTLIDSRTIIKIFSVEDGKHLCSIKGHHDLIHDMNWSADDSVLITASADGSVKVWNTLDKDQDIPDKFNYLYNDNLFFIESLFHPSFVYCCVFFQDEHSYGSTTTKIIVTACYDQKIRFWILKLSGDGEYIKHQCVLVLDILDLAEIQSRTFK